MKQNRQLKIATMTFHMAHNYGAMLQAYALEHTVNQMGFPCEVLDYRFPYIDQWSGIRSAGDLYQESGLVGLAKYVWRMLRGDYRDITPVRRKFDRFMRKELKLSHKVYFGPEDIRNAEYDAVLFGSDQIWNPDLTDGFAPEYVGKFFDTERIRLIAYAASCGTDRFKEEWRDDFLPLLRRFSAIGIREKGLADYINKVYSLPARTVLDPVFLPERADWDRLADGADISVNEPYVLVYAFDTGEGVYDLARRIGRERGLKIVTVSYSRDERYEDMLQLTDCGPKDFVKLIRDAQFVCTTSFHGMAFSILLEKNFYCFGHPKYSQRNADLLDMIGMGDRLLFDGDLLPEVCDCDYTSPREKLCQLRKESKGFLRNALSAQ